MEQITLRLSEDTLESLEDADEVRSEYEAKVDELRQEHKQEVSELQRDMERLRNEKHTLINDRQEKQELVEYVQEEQPYREAPLKNVSRGGCGGRTNDRTFFCEPHVSHNNEY